MSQIPHDPIYPPVEVSAESRLERMALRPKQAAAALGISRAHLYLLVRDGLLKARKIGRCTVFLRTDLVAFLATI